MARIADQKYELVALDSITPHPDNPNQGDAASIRDSIDHHDFYGAIIVQRSTGHILAGNHRYLAARAAGLTEVPVIVVDYDDDQARRILVGDNQLARLATWDEGQLAGLLQDLAVQPGELSGTGFTTGDLDDLLRRSGTLGNRAAGFVDDYLAANREHGHGSHPDPATVSSGSSAAPPAQETKVAGDGYVPVTWTVTLEQRDLIRAAIKQAQERKKIGTAAEGLVAIAREYLASTEA